MNHYDVIIIWSGLGGLSAGAILSQRWKKVLVLEKHYLIGGYATNFKRKRFEFDVALHQIGWVQKTGFKDILKKAWVYEKLRFIKHTYLYEAIYPDFTLRVENGNGEKFQKDLIALFPKESFGIRLWFWIMKYVWAQLKVWDFGQRNRVFFPIVLLFAPLFIPLLAFGSKLRISTVLNLCTRDTKLQKILMELIGYYGDDLNLSAVYYLIASYGYYFDGGYFIKGGWQAVSDAFADVIRQNGGEVKHSSEVTEILLERESAIGVRTSKWDFFAGHIIANASPFIVYEHLLKNWGKRDTELKRLQSFEVWPTIGSLYIGLDTTIEKLNPQYTKSYIVAENETYDISFAKNHAIGFTITNHEDNKGIPVGKTVITVALFLRYADWGDLTKETYQMKKEQETERILTRLEKYFPNIRDHIEVIELGTPKTMERYTGNRFWSIYGFSQKVWQAFSDGYGNTTPIKNLFLSSAWSFGGWFEWVIRAGDEVSRKIQ